MFYPEKLISSIFFQNFLNFYYNRIQYDLSGSFFFLNIIFLKLQCDPCHAEEDFDDADAGWPAAEPSQRTLRRALCGCLSREKNSLQPISAARCQGAAVGLNAASYSHLTAHQPPSHMLPTKISLSITETTLFVQSTLLFFCPMMISLFGFIQKQLSAQGFSRLSVLLLISPAVWTGWNKICSQLFGISWNDG